MSLLLTILYCYIEAKIRLLAARKCKQCVSVNCETCETCDGDASIYVDLCFPVVS